MALKGGQQSSMLQELIHPGQRCCLHLLTSAVCGWPLDQTKVVEDFRALSCSSVLWENGLCCISFSQGKPG